MARLNRKELVALVVDDSASMRQFLSAVLRQNGVDRVHEAADGAAGLRVMRDASPAVNLVFCDLEMPQMDGVDTLRRVALAHPDVSIVVFSGLDPRILSTVAQMSEIHGLEVLGVLGKPFSEGEVASLLDRWREARRHNVRIQRAELTPDEIEAALKEDRIDVHYQIVTRMRDGEPLGVEALVRLNDPHLGILSPAAFLPVAESANLITPITHRVLEKSLEQASIWKSEGLELGLSINLAPHLLRRLDLPDAILGVCNKHRFPTDRVTLEITESRMDLSPEMLHNAARLRIKGFNLSVDDFGTGDSGIARLRTLPFTELKIDRLFTGEALQREDLRTMLRTSIELGHRLHMQVVAEGVENWDQWRLLQGFDCDIAQGFLAAPALPADQIPDVTTAWRARMRAQLAAAGKTIPGVH